MKTIKFRIWDGTEMIEWNTLKDFDNPDYIFNNTANEVWEVMQFTGLHDKNGKEIYEGDIVRYPVNIPESLESHSIAEVKWKADSFGLSNAKVIEKSTVTFYEWSELEIIGNIYEHPHLLTKENE